MGHILKSLMKGVGAFGLIVSLALNFVPATPGEERALGPEPPRMLLVQARIATAAMRVAPDQAVALMSQMTGVSESRVRVLLEDLTIGTSIAEAEAEAAAPPSARRIEAGGALFVRAE